MERTYVRRRIVVLLAVSAALAPWMAPLRAAVSSEAVPVSSQTYVVRQGDSLWSIAQNIAPDQDPRILADAIAAENSVDPGALEVGQILALPTR